jgi:hypothetical protein
MHSPLSSAGILAGKCWSVRLKAIGPPLLLFHAEWLPFKQVTHLPLSGLKEADVLRFSSMLQRLELPTFDHFTKVKQKLFYILIVAVGISNI